MPHGSDQLLQQLEELVDASQFSGLGQLDELPKMIAEHIKLEAVGLELFYFLQRQRRSIVYPPGADHAAQLSGRLLREVLNTGTFRQHGSITLCPLVVAGQNVGLLWLAGAIKTADHGKLARLVRLLGSLLERIENKSAGHARILAQLSRNLHAAESLPALVATLGRGLLRYNQTAVVVLRPLYGGTVLGTPCLKIIPGLRKWQPMFCALEEDFSAQFLSSSATLTLQTLPQPHPFSAGMQPHLLALPLLTRQRQVGVLTLVGGEWSITPTGSVDFLDQEFLQSLADVTAHCLERQLDRERFAQLLDERERKLRENATLYRINRAVHSTLKLDKLTHLVLSAATVPDGGGFERAFLFLLNERSQTLQGMLGVNRDTALQVLPADRGLQAWDAPCLTEKNLQAQRNARVNRAVLKQRVGLDSASPLARAVSSGQVVLVSQPGAEPDPLVSSFGLSPYACVPLVGNNRRLGGLVVDNPFSGEPVAVEQVRFLELFASLATSAVENSMLLGRLEKAHHELLETQEQLIQGERLAVLGEMSASVAHELKNPLVSIGGFARRLTRLPDSGPLQQEYAEIIARETSRMEEMLGQILAFSKKQILCMDSCSMAAIIDDATEVAGEALQGAGANLVREVAKSLPQIVADHQKLRQVLVNLIVNACQVTALG
ncbi:MAG TPA: histidine kinase dimerization/phospho-acceptor domain-containing protein, partial [Geothermobacteraceae bacterium]|nr:histidine kinase dimerization/phospho-acceptor domain-containing protein [Geothermobacteraceae bacterium]